MLHVVVRTSAVAAATVCASAAATHESLAGAVCSPISELAVSWQSTVPACQFWPACFDLLFAALARFCAEKGSNDAVEPPPAMRSSTAPSGWSAEPLTWATCLLVM